MDIKTKRELIHIHSDLMSALCLIDELDESVIDMDISAARQKIARAAQAIHDKINTPKAGSGRRTPGPGEWWCDCGAMGRGNQCPACGNRP